MKHVLIHRPFDGSFCAHMSQLFGPIHRTMIIISPQWDSGLTRPLMALSINIPLSMAASVGLIKALGP